MTAGGYGPGSRSLCPGRREMKIGTIAANREGVWRRVRSTLRQLVIPLRQPVQAEREADTLFGGLEDDEGGGLGALEQAQELVVHDNLGDAAVGQAAHEAGAVDVLVVEL